MNKPLALLVGLLGIVFLVMSFIYFTTPANALPHFLPGYDIAVSRSHYKHGVASLILGLGCFAFAWFQSGKKST